MQRTRRGLLGAGVGIAAGAAGCLGVRGVEYPDAAPDATDGDDGEPDPPGDEQLDDPDPVLNESLAAATRNVVDDAVWFATEYADAVATYRDAIAGVVAEVDAVRAAADESDAVTVEMVDRLDAAARAAADRAAEALEPHFHPEARIRGRARRHVEELRTVAPRNDVDRFLEELDRMRRGFASIGTAIYVAEAFSRDPIHNRLLDRLLYPLPEGDERRREVRGTAFVEVALASRGFAAFAHEPYDDDRYDRSRIPRIYGGAFGADRREELRARLGPVPRSEDRTDELFVAFADRPSAGNRPSETFEGWASELDGTPLYVQRYPDADTASERLVAVLADASTEGRAPIDPGATAAGSDFSGNGSADGDGGSADGDETGADDGPARWHRLYHDEAEGERYGFDEHAGVQYGYVVRAGEFLLAAGFSGDAWEERAGWQGRLADGWGAV
ncbi:hypothetical protein [Halorubrum sp. Ea8]|uniref:hypothetical protein n=2 Tax=unclassified Halorubrum TaxID=2642239 RepID=UPI000B9815E0|nr:hypothetical protein [Halorubrum sp. Ea8]OYR45668.1 hypothetical protein DJ74_15980 [Halorubrum sp. Ea8]